jgi:cytochrome P450
MKDSPEAAGMPEVELAFDLGILADAGLDTSTVALDWFIVAWITSGSRGWVKRAQRNSCWTMLSVRTVYQALKTVPSWPISTLLVSSTFDSNNGQDLTVYDMTASETLRWRPVVVQGVPHFTKVEDGYMGYHIPANSTVLPNAFAITRDEAVFGEDVDNFVPERWLAEESNKEHVDVCGFNTSALKGLPHIGFGFGHRIYTGRLIARNQLFIQMARMLWSFDVEAGVVDEATGARHKVHEMDCTEGFVTQPKPFRSVMRPRGQWVRGAILEAGTTHNLDHSAVLEAAKIEKS